MHSNQTQDGTFVTLDGLRGIAALIVVIFHINGIIANYDFSSVLTPHAYLAVDFFFMLSGFVIAYTYDKRWGSISIGDFFRLRLIRLHPMVVLAMVIGVAGNVINPFIDATLAERLPSLIVTVVLGLLMIPSPSTLPNREDALFSLNSPLWSLSLEYAANILYALVLRRMTTARLSACTAFCCISLIVMATATDRFVGGFNWPTVWVAPFRLLPPFLLGVLCARSTLRTRMPKISFFALTLLLIVVLAAPVLPHAGTFSLNGLYDALCVVFIFPLLIMAGTSSPENAKTRAGCIIAGKLSYPLYTIHMPFVYIYADYFILNQPGTASLLAWGTAMTLAFILLSFLAEKYWELPLRRKLKARVAKQVKVTPVC